MPSCHNCDAANPDGARFCNQCGTRLGNEASAEAPRRVYTPRHLVERVLKTRAALIGERKRVTVLFVDIKGSTRLAEQAGAEAWHLILDRYFTLLSGAVHRYEGTVNQYTGDGIMALFGAPLAHEDHAVRACFAALEMQRQVRLYADELRLSSGLNLSIRVGLNTGEVIVGAIGDDLRMDYTAQGLTVNLAARMEQICEPGRIYATRNTAVLAEGYFRLRDLGEMTVAGQDQPLRVYEVEGEGVIKTRLERGLARGAARASSGARPSACNCARRWTRPWPDAARCWRWWARAASAKSRLRHEFPRNRTANAAASAVHARYRRALCGGDAVPPGADADAPAAVPARRGRRGRNSSASPPAACCCSKRRRRPCCRACWNSSASPRPPAVGVPAPPAVTAGSCSSCWRGCCRRADAPQQSCWWRTCISPIPAARPSWRC